MDLSAIVCLIYGGYDNLIQRLGAAGRLIRGLLYYLENTPLQVFGLSHFMVVEKMEDDSDHNKSLMVCVIGRWAGIDSAWQQEKLNARQMLEKAVDSYLSSARRVGRLAKGEYL